MDHSTTDQAWQKIQARIEMMLRQSLDGGLHLIEYKPHDVIYLLEMSSGHKEEIQTR
ncbi:MAG TPA: hypothetical protein VMT12_14605 [Syntrophales bacterium]|nr:hypothetical protein [Syntrophales bacterium]